MRVRLLLLLTLLGSVTIFAFVHFARLAKAPVASSAQAPSPPAAPEFGFVDFGAARSAADVQRALEDAYRLGVDRRMVAAVADVRGLLAGGSGAASATWELDHWNVRCGADDAGRWPEAPGFADALGLLETFAKSELARHPLPAGAPDGRAALALADDLPESALAFLDHAWSTGGPSRALLAQALAAAVQLAVPLAGEPSGEADTLAARALALLALARAAGDGPHEREACALAWAMGYRDEARSLAAALPARDPLRMLALREDQQLLARARSDSATTEVRLLALLSLARGDRFDEWYERAPEWFPAKSQHLGQALATALGFSRFDVSRGLPAALGEVSLKGLEGPTTPGATGNPGIGPFELAMREQARRTTSPVAHGLVVANRRALYYSGLVVATRFAAHMYSDAQATKDIADASAASGSGRAAGLAGWQDHLAAAKTGSPSHAALRADLDSPALSPTMATSTFEALVEDGLGGSPEVRDAGRALVARLDSRPSSQELLAWEVQGYLLWPEYAEKLLASAATRTGSDDPRLLAALCLMRRDVAGLDAIVAREDLPPRDAMYALRLWVRSDSSAADRLEPRFAAVLARDPGDWFLADGLADLREARGRFVAAEVPVRTWMSRPRPNADALEETVARTTLARLRRKQNDVAGALLIMGDLDQGQQGAAMAEKARLLALDHHLPAALEIARVARERYPDSEISRGLAAELYWRAGDLAGAAKSVAELDPECKAWRDGFVPVFLNVFHGRPEQADSAIAAMRGVVPLLSRRAWTLGSVASLTDPALAIRLMQDTPNSGGVALSMQLGQIYSLIRSTNGEAAALSWLNARRIARGLYNFVEMDLASRGELAGAWSCGEREGAQHDEFSALTRAAAWTLAGSPAGPQRDSLLAWAHAPGGTYYRDILRYLVGERDENAVLELGVDRHRRAEVWYYCAIKARSEHRLRDAARWYQLVLETGSIGDGEWIWARRELNDWASCWCTPERLPASLTQPATRL